MQHLVFTVPCGPRMHILRPTADLTKLPRELVVAEFIYINILQKTAVICIVHFVWHISNLHQTLILGYSYMQYAFERRNQTMFCLNIIMYWLIYNTPFMPFTFTLKSKQINKRYYYIPYEILHVNEKYYKCTPPKKNKIKMEH